ncbi:T9SS type A sorting domain-containing protein [Chryseobacterium sp. SSA4.19]|uniref:T9SS type A sorting domain-containing protein n=1 Tax=Chryseobacterium sp. SSA4.19 TaxID=2919915 RepID=UPI001F4DC7A1|nr:T9SS type A sorting domain-containing protein [Chryseobacterium sp. SSA4.19]MCJ8154791.1 T9SS type A sorting domain-containing protein [Chryseobacterium sp. SSA4.19]
MKKYVFLFIFAAGSSNAQLFSESFEGGVLPVGWVANNPDTSENWTVGTGNSFATFPSGAAFFDDNNSGESGVNSNATLTSPVINLTAAAGLKLSFKYANMMYNDDSTLKVEVFDGTSWAQVFIFAGEAGDWGLDPGAFVFYVDTYAEATDIDLTPYMSPNFQLRFIYDDAGDYSYGAVVDDVVIYSDLLSTSDVSVKNIFDIYPNPVKDHLYIIRSDLKSKYIISVIDMSGKIIKTFREKSDSYNLSDLSKGTYMIQITTDHLKIRKKIIKQ